MTPKEQSNADEAAASFADNIPPHLYRFYKNLVAQGFTDMQAFQLTLNWFNNLTWSAVNGRGNSS